MTIAFGAIGAKAASGGTTVAIPYPASPGLGDLAITCRVGWNASQATFTDETGWTNRGDKSGGVSTGIDAHTTRIHTDTKELTGSESGSVTFDMSANAGMIGVMARYTKAGSSAWDISYADGDDNTHGANRSVTTGALDLAPGDVVVALVATDTDTGITITSPAFTGSGITFDTPNQRTTSAEAGTNLGNDGNLEVFDAAVSAGSGSVAVTFAFTTATSQCGPVAILRLREVGTTATGSMTLSGSAVASTSATGSLTLSGSSDASTPANATGSLSLSGVAITNPTATATGSLDLSGSTDAPASVGATGSLDLSGSAAPGTSVSATGSLSLSGSAGASTPASATGSLSLSGSADATSGGGSVSATGSLTLFASMGTAIGIPEAPPVEIDQDVVDDSPVDQATHEAYWHTDVAVVAPPEPLPVAYDILRVFTDVTLSGTEPVAVGVVDVRKRKLRTRILVDNVDITFYNGIRTPTPDFSLIEPCTYGVCTLVLPQIFPLIQNLSAITWLRRGARVIIQRVDDLDNVVATDYRGRIMGWDTSGVFTVSVGGMFSGPASVRFRPMPMVRRIADVGYWLMTAFRRLWQPLEYEELGVGLITRGENYYLDHVLELCALGVKQDGSQITVHYDEALRKWIAAPKDKTTIHATVYFDAGNMNPELTRDFTVETDEVFVTAHLSDGTQILNSVWPGMQQEDPIPTYPGPLALGDNNEDVKVLVARLALLGYLKFADPVDGYDSDIANAIYSARVDAEQLGSADDYALDEDLWDWLWDLGAVGYTDKEARILPLVQRKKTRKWDRSATGNRIALNSDYDPVYSALTVSQKLELGHVKSKNHAKQLARTLIVNEDNWVGTLSTVMSFVVGEHTPGDPITEADLMSGRDLRPGMNLWAPLFQGGTLFHISSIDVSEDGDAVSLAIDTRFRDTMQIDGILERNRENRTSPARAFWNARSSSSAQDTIFSHDEHFGILGKNIDLPAGEWIVYPVPAGDYGTVANIIMETKDDKAEFAMMVFQKKVTAEWLAARAPNPLNSADEWWANESVRADFKSRGIKYAAGSEEDPCGYFPGRKSRGHPLTGRWEDDYEFAYGGDSLVFWVCVYADRPSVLKRGEQFAVQRELGT